MTNNTRVEQTAGAGTRHIKNEWQTQIQIATNTTNQQRERERTYTTQLKTHNSGWGTKSRVNTMSSDFRQKSQHKH